MKAIGITVTTLFMLFVSQLASGYTLSVLWGWLVRPVFPAMPGLGVLDAIGITIVVRFLAVTPAAKKDDRTLTTIITHGLVWVVVFNGLFLGIGWGIHLLRGG